MLNYRQAFISTARINRRAKQKQSKAKPNAKHKKQNSQAYDK